MNFKNITIILVLLLTGILSSCKKEYPTPDSISNCTINYQSHPKNDQYQKILNYYTSHGYVGMTLLVEDSTNGLWIGSSGYADIENHIKMTPCHLHHTASIYKTFISVIIMELVEEGKLSLDDKVSKYVSDGIIKHLTNGGKMTIINLLQHRSGLPDIFDASFVLDFFNDPSKSYSIEDLMKYVYDLKALSEPGTDFYYSDANFALLTLVINRIDGYYANSIKTRIFQKLNLTESYFVDSPSQIPVGVANSYWDRYGDGKIENVSDWQINLTSGLRGTDGIITSAKDMKLFIQGIVNGTLVSSSSLSQMTEFIDVSAKATQEQGIRAYGLGLAKVMVSSDTWFGHFGNHIGSGAIALYNPARKITIVVFQNTGTFFSDKVKPVFYNQLIRDIENIAYQ